MANAVRCPFPPHSLPQDEITRLGADQTGTSSSNAVPSGGITGSSLTAALGNPPCSGGAAGGVTVARAGPWPFPLSDPLAIDGAMVAARQVVATVGPTLTAERRRRIDQVVAARTFAVAPVLEQIADAGNVAALLRSVEGLGYGGVHLVPATAADGRERPPNRVTQGAEKWLLTRFWESSAACVAGLRAAGYRIAATMPGGRSIPLASLDLSTPVAIAFGNEHRGVSELLAAEADQLVTVPMYGFSRSFNVSVAAAVVLAHLRERLPREARNWQPSAAQRLLLTAHYYLASQPLAASLLRRSGALGTRTHAR